MLAKVCSAASNHGMHRIERAVSHRSSAGLSQLNAECLWKLRKVDIGHSTRSQLEVLDDKYRYRLHEEVASEYAAIPDHTIFSPDNSPEAEERAKGLQLSCALWSAMKFQESYSVSLPGMSLDTAMNPGHRRYLIETFNTTWQSLASEERGNLLQVIRPEVVAQLGLTLSAEEKKFLCDLHHHANRNWVWIMYWRWWITVIHKRVISIRLMIRCGYGSCAALPNSPSSQNA